MKTRIIILFLSIPLSLWAQTPFGNSMKVRIPAAVSNTTEPDDPNKTRISEYHFDGFGGEFCRAGISQSPTGRDMIQFSSYDPMGRQVKDYLPFAGSMEDLAGMQQAQASFYRSALRVPHTQFAYSQVRFDASPGGELLEQSFPGYDWRMGGAHTVQQSSNANLQGQVRRLMVDESGSLIDGGFYLPNSLQTLLTSSEQDISQLKVFDSKGRVIMQANAFGTASETRTYFVYDKLGRLSVVLPPMAVNSLDEAASWSLSFLQEDWIYSYKYDGKDRVIEAKIPGKDVSLYVYDRLGRTAMMQDGNQRQQNKWWIILYDGFDRKITEGILDDPQSLSRAQWQNRIDSMQLLNPLSDISGSRIHNAASRYSLPAWFDASHFTPLHIYYYDDHEGFPAYLTEVLIPNIFRPDHMGMLTGHDCAVLDASVSRWVRESYYYDGDGNMVRSFKSFGNDVLLKTSAKYNLLGQPVSQHKTWNLPSGFTPSLIDIKYIYEYNESGRLKTEKILSDGVETILASHKYNEAGQRIETNLGSSNGGDDYLQSLDFSYNTRGWLTHINNAALSNDMDQMLFNEVVGAEDELRSILFDGLTMRIDQAMESPEYELIIEDEKKFEFIEGSSSLIRVESYDEKSRERIDERELDTLSMVQLQLAEGQSLLIDLNGLQLLEGGDPQDIIDTALVLLSARLGSLGINDAKLIEELSEKLVRFLRGRMGMAYHNDDSNDLWGMELSYQNPVVGAVPRYDGLISQMKWRTMNPADEGMRYDYEYDMLLRLRAANYLQTSSGQWSGAGADYSTGPIEFDANGNITRMKRKGLVSIDASGNDQIFGVIDDLDYFYSGNRLIKVMENADPILQDLPGFSSPDPLPQGGHYDYDANGNLILDLNKGIELGNNILDLPARAQFLDNSQSFSFQYDASGRKLSQVLDDGNQSLEVNYYDDAIFHNGELTYILHPYGRMTWVDGSPRYDYDLKDHLGNVRLSITDLDNDHVAEVLQEHHYYPFGMEMGGKSKYFSSPNSPYQFGTKERIGSGTLEWYDFGARYYDPQLGRWNAVDPMAEERVWLSTYNYCQNNPINRIDPTGALDDDYLIRNNGEIVVKKTDDKFDRFYTESSQRIEGSMLIRTYSLAVQLDKNDEGYLALPSVFKGNGYGFTYTGSKNENYISGPAFAGLLGALKDAQVLDVSLNHWSNADGTSPKPSRSHKNGEVGDIRPLRLDQSGKPVLTTDAQFDITRNATLVGSLKKFGWTSVLSERNPTTGCITPGATHYSGYKDKKTGNWVPVRHNNHFHIQKFKPNLITYTPYQP